MGEAKRKKWLNPNYGKAVLNSVPPGGRIKTWLYSPELRTWLHCRQPINWEPALSLLLKNILQDRKHDHTIEIGDIAIGVNLENWTFWFACFSKGRGEIIDYPVNVWGQQIKTEHIIFPTRQLP